MSAEFPLEDDDLAAAVDGSPGADSSGEQFSIVVDESAAGHRLDAFLAAAIPAVSRARIKRGIDRQLARVEGRPERASYRVSAGQRISLTLPEAAAGPQAEPIPLEVLFEDDWLVVINKPPGMVVHPAKGHWNGTLAAALVHRFEQSLSTVGGAVRPGIVHRLDRDTSGVIVVAKTDAAHEALAVQFHDRIVAKEYLAIVAGRPDRDADRVVAAIGPHGAHREKMALREDHPESRAAETFFEVVERFPGFALVRAKPKTGRTHQIRLHLMHLRTPVLCDKLYGGRAKMTAGELRAITRRNCAAGVPDGVVLLGRQALHAQRIALAHPASGARMSFEAPLPADMLRMLAALRETSSS
ncbi:MAG TPA: RluA family pseudouridine synthase [Lacipirellulaceae bacterium]|nr:RluA family pseudouridine synthase [Lacipirellulaceae bacterium]